MSRLLKIPFLSEKDATTLFFGQKIKKPHLPRIEEALQRNG